MIDLEAIVRQVKSESKDHQQLNFLSDRNDPEPVGTYLASFSRITGYITNWDGTKLAELNLVDRYGNAYQKFNSVHGAEFLDPNRFVVVTHPSEFWIP